MFRIGNFVFLILLICVVFGLTGLVGGSVLINTAEANIAQQNKIKNDDSRKKAKLKRQREQQKQSRLERKRAQKKQARLERKRAQRKEARLKRKRAQRKEARLERKWAQRKQARQERKRERQEKQATPKFQGPKNKSRRAKNNSGSERIVANSRMPDSFKNGKNQTSTDKATVEIIPLRDLGTDRGKVCFSVSAYSRKTESDPSQSVCTILKNNKPIKLAWRQNAGDVIGYRIYRGKTKNHTNDFLFDL